VSVLPNWYVPQLHCHVICLTVIYSAQVDRICPGSIVRYIRGALALLPYLGLLAPEESESVKRPVRATRLRRTSLDLRPVRHKYLYPPPSPHILPSPLATPAQNLAVLDGSPIVYVPPNEKRGASIILLKQKWPLGMIMYTLP